MKSLRSRMAVLVWLLPALILVLTIIVYPIIRTLGLSLQHKSLATGFRSSFAGFDNFVRIATDSRFAESLWTTTIFTVVSVAAEFGIGLLLALSVHSLRKWSSTVRTIILVPWTLPTAVIAVLWAWILNDQYGAINILSRLGHFAPLAEPRTATLAIILADVWKTVPFVFLVLLSGLQNIPGELYEAIEIDGGGAMEKFRYVTWPHLMPFAFVAALFRIVQAFAVFDLVWVMTGGGPGGATETVSIYTYRMYMRYLDFGYAAALVVTTVAILATVAAGLYRLLITRYEQSF